MQLSSDLHQAVDTLEKQKSLLDAQVTRVTSERAKVAQLRGLAELKHKTIPLQPLDVQMPLSFAGDPMYGNAIELLDTTLLSLIKLNEVSQDRMRAQAQPVFAEFPQ